MKQILIFFPALFFSIYGNGQSDSAYQTLIAKAGLFHLQKDYKNAIIYLEKAFQQKQPDALNAYKAAGAYSLDSNADKAYYYLEFALSSGWTEADWLLFDPYFDYLKNSMADKWQKTKQKAFAKEKLYEQTLRQPALRKQINLMTLNDQKRRY